MSKTSDIENLFDTMIQLKKLIFLRTDLMQNDKAATMLQFASLNLLKDSSSLTVGELAKHLMLSKSSATQLVERLVRSGFVTRTPNPTDRRIINLTVTKTGDIHIAFLKKEIVSRLEKIFSRIPSEDTRTLIRIHNELIKTLRADNVK